MSRARELANLGNNAGGLETLTVSDITDLSVSGSNINSATNQITDSSTDLNVDSNTLVVDKSENKVGIGTTPSIARLQIQNSNDNTDWPLATYNDNGNVGFYVTQNASGDQQLKVNNNSGTTNVQLNSNGDSYLNGGNVGIGTSSLTGGNVALDILKTGSGVGSQIRLKNDHNGGFYIGQSGDTTGDVIVHNDGNTNMKFATNGDERMKILADGRIMANQYLRTGSTTEGLAGMQQWVYSASITGTNFELGRVSMQYDNVSYIMFIHNEYGSWNSINIQGTFGYGSFTYDSVAALKRVEPASNTDGSLMNSDGYNPALYLARQSGYTSGTMTIRVLMICFSRSTINNVASGGNDIWDNTNMTRIQ